MTTYNPSLFSLSNAQKSLSISTKGLLATALLGQWAFAFYIFMVYTLTLMNGLNIENFSPAPHIKETIGFDRLIFLSHIIPAIYLSLFGLMQLIPAIRNKYRRFHRWNCRIFLFLGFWGALSGLYLQWLKGEQGINLASLGITINGLLIMIAASLAWYNAVNKRFDKHMRWAVHTFILVNGVWSFRLYLMGWYTVNQGPNGNTPNLDGFMDIFLAFACYLLPMAIAELYFWANRQRDKRKVWLGAIATTMGLIITFIGVFSAVLMMWTPRIERVIGAL